MKAKIINSIMNTMSGLGLMQDKTTHNKVIHKRPSDYEITSAYNSMATFNRIINTKSNDAVAQWREFASLEPSKIKEITKKETELDIKEQIFEFVKSYLLYGAAVMYLSLEGEKQSPASEKGNLSGLKCISKDAIVKVNQNDDKESEEYLNINSITIKVGDEEIEVHSSRLIVFGYDLSSSEWAQPEWGFLKQIVTDYEATLQSLAHLTHEAKIAKVKLPETFEELGTKAEEIVIKRIELYNSFHSNMNAYVLGKDEEFTRDVYNFSGFKDVIADFRVQISLACGIPITKLFGVSPAGMNATGESDAENYRMTIRQIQDSIVRKAINRIDKHIGASEYNWEFKKISPPSRAEKADTDLKIAQTVKIAHDMGFESLESLEELKRKGVLSKG